jgi:hypothetical protein
MKFIVEQKLFIYKTFVQHSSWRKFHRKYPDTTVSHKAMIYSTETKLHSMELMLNENNLERERY